MARQIPSNHRLLSTSNTGFAIGTLFLCALALFMCAKHSHRWPNWRACYGYKNKEPIIQLNQEGVHTYHLGEAHASAYSGDVSAVWKKNILMGGKCQLPDFSGVIMYDSAGNIISPAQKSQHAVLALPWK